MLRLPETHSKKAFKIPLNDFYNNVGIPRGTVRYDTLHVTGSDINVKWDPEELNFKISGTYGKV